MAKISIATQIKQYQKIILEVLEAEYNDRKIDTDNLFMIVDKTHKHYQLVYNGFRQLQYIYNVLIHFQIVEDGKIWIWLNHTESLIADELMKKGVPASDIVLGFHPKQYRAYSGFSVT